jgi:hypothetical protein
VPQPFKCGRQFLQSNYTQSWAPSHAFAESITSGKQPNEGLDMKVELKKNQEQIELLQAQLKST